MLRRPATGHRALVLGVLASLPVRLAAGEPILLREVCDDTTLLSLVGVDTQERTALLAMASRQAAVPGWVLELRPGASRVALHPDPQRAARFGGSIGPGPVFSFLPCGEGCVQPEVWRDGAWRDLGGPLAVPVAATLHATWDREGVAWVLSHRPAAEPGRLMIEAFRLQGDAWQSRGGGTARAVGSPGARPDPDLADAVVAGTLRFSALAAPSYSVVALPGLAKGVRATLLPLAGGATALLTAESRLFVSADRGASWQEQLWTPWRSRQARAEGPVGTDYWLDLPSGHDADLPLLWMDERAASDLGVWITTGSGKERRSLEGVEKGEPVELALHFADGSWLLVGGCRSDQRTASVMLRDDTGPWRPVALGAGW